MENILLIIIAVLSLAAVALLFAVLSKLKNARDSQNGVDATSAVAELKNKTDAGFAAIGAASKAQSDAINQRIGELTKANSDQQRELVKTIADIREDLSNAARRQTEDIRNSVSEMQKSNEKKLDEMRATVDEKLTATLSERLDGSFKTVSEQLSNVYKSLGEMQKLSDGIGSLNRMFTGVKLRGTWAEAQLEAILEKIIPGMFVKNYAPSGGEGIVEFAVKVPDADGGITYLPLDSKFPAEDYIRLTEEAEKGNADGVKEARAALAKRVISEAKAVRKYIAPPETTPFAVMYLATDALYAEVVSLPDNVTDRVHDGFSVMIAGPSTITALLSSLAMGFKTVALNRKAAEVMDILAAAKTQYDKFAVSLDKVEKKINEAGSALTDAKKRNELITKNLRKVETIDETEADGILSLE